LDLIDQPKHGTVERPGASAEIGALRREVKRRRARRGAFPVARAGQGNYRDVIDRNHPINRLSDETLNRMASDIHIDSE
jgi:hypothetical protein